MSFEVNALASAKILLHAAKYPTVGVNGVLLGRKTAKGESSSDASVSVLDVVPLFHTNLNLAPMLDIALEQVRLEDLVIHRSSGSLRCGKLPNFRSTSTLQQKT